jgi:tetratricopeptide (TPR) repeat protein
MAQTEYRAGQYDNVLAPRATGEIVDQVKKLAKGNEPIRVKDHRLTGEILALALRANVQKGKVNEAKEILGLLRRLTGEGEEGGTAAAVLQTLVQELRSQVRELREKKDLPKLEATVKNFSAFLDELGKEPSYKGQKEQLLFLANCYASLDKHAEAAKLYSQIPEPKIDPKKAKLTAEEERELQNYWLMQVFYGKALRQARQFPEATKVLQRALTDPASRAKFLAEKEDIHLLEDQELYGKAVTRWGQYLTSPQMKRALADLKNKDAQEQRRVKELYYECFYHYTYCQYMYGKKNPTPAKRDEWIGRAADRIVRLQEVPDAWELVGARFRALLAAEEPLRQAYEKLKGPGKK